MVNPSRRVDHPAGAWTILVFALGCAFMIVYWSRSQVAGDQLNMLARGWLLVVEGTLLACAVTPTAVMSWQLLTVFHLAVMPLMLLGLHHIQKRRAATVHRATCVYAMLAFVMAVAIGWASPMYRCGGTTCDSMNATPPPLRSNHEMLESLGIQDTCPFQVDVPGGWWPDVLPVR